jgi:hypothetical protein
LSKTDLRAQRHGADNRTNPPFRKIRLSGRSVAASRGGSIEIFGLGRLSLPRLDPFRLAVSFWRVLARDTLLQVSACRPNCGGTAMLGNARKAGAASRIFTEQVCRYRNYGRCRTRGARHQNVAVRLQPAKIIIKAPLSPNKSAIACL